MYNHLLIDHGLALILIFTSPSISHLQTLAHYTHFLSHNINNAQWVGNFAYSTTKAKSYPPWYLTSKTTAFIKPFSGDNAFCQWSF